MTGSVGVTVWDDGAAPAGRAVFVHGSTTWGSSAFARQRPLAARYRLELMDRRGYGASPDTDHSDARVDARDLIELLEEPAHLVGHSFGTVVVMLAAVERPESVRSLALIEPSAYRPVADDPVVSAALQRNRAATADGPDGSDGLGGMAPADYLRLSTESLGLPPLEPTADRLRAAATAMAERPCWDLDVSLAAIASASWPKLVINGTWETAPATYRALGGEPLMACGRATAVRIRAGYLSVPGAAHEPHWEAADTVNTALAELWDRPQS